MSDSSFRKYHIEVMKSLRRHPQWRIGQTYFNVLYDMNTPLAEKVRATPYDPFHSDERIESFLAFVERNWDATGE